MVMRMVVVWVAACAGIAALAQPLPTAVYTLADHHTSRWTTESDPLVKIAGVCRITPAGPSFQLACAAPPVEEKRAGRRHYYTIALFSDLEETLYQAACARQSADDACDELKAGETFSAEIEDRTLRIVYAGRQLALRILEKRPKPVTIDSPVRGTLSQVQLSPGTPSETRYSQALPSRGTPSQVPPSEVFASAGAPSTGTPAETGPSVVAPTHGRLVVYCPDSAASVYLDGQLLGTGSIEAPLRPGRHTIGVRLAGYRNFVRTVEVPPGGTVRLRADLRR